MSNFVTLELKQESEVLVDIDNKKLMTPDKAGLVNVYVKAGWVDTWLGTIDTYKDLEYILEHFDEELQGTLMTERELEIVRQTLENSNYVIYINNEPYSILKTSYIGG